MPHDILVLNVAAHGHIYSSLAVVTELVRRGHRVTYVMAPEFKEPVEATGATVVPYESKLAQTNLLDVLESDDDGSRAHMMYLDENVEILRAAEHHFGASPPDLVVYDSFPFIAGMLLAGKWGRPAVRLHAGFASNENFSYSQEVVDEAEFIDPVVMEKFNTKLADLMASHGNTTPMEQFWSAIEDFNVVFVPKAFQIAGDTFDDRFCFAGPCMDEVLGGWQPPPSGLPVVLVSLGAAFNDRADFFRNCIRSFADAPWHTVMSVGQWLDPTDLGPLPANVEVHQWVPHLAVLEHAQACLTHGGVGTVMQSLYWGKPLVIAPQSPDAMPVARRVANLGLGRLMPTNEDNGDRLRDAIAEVSSDPTIATNVQNMQHHVRAAGGATEAADQILTYLASQKTPHSA